MTKPEAGEEARAADDATISSAHRSTVAVSDLTELVAAARGVAPSPSNGREPRRTQVAPTRRPLSARAARGGRWSNL